MTDFDRFFAIVSHIFDNINVSVRIEAERFAAFDRLL